ncbi:MAG: hypothetical protein ABS960_00700 [Solibacillus isronensis]
MKRVIEIILCIFIVIFLFGIIAMGFQVIGVDSTNKATIVGGLLSMIGGAIGALGAYFVASNQMKKQFEHEKRKEDKQRKETIEQVLKKLKFLNSETISFIDFFNETYSPPFDQEKNKMLKFSVQDLGWIVNNVNNINDEILMDGYVLDYLKFSRHLNNMYIDVEGFEFIPNEQKPVVMRNLIKSILENRETFILFDDYVKERLREIQIELENLN